MSIKSTDRLTPDNTALLLVDHQTGLANGVTDQSIPEFRTAVAALAATAKLFNLPAIITTSAADGPNGPLLPEILSYMWRGLMVHEDSTGQRVELTPWRVDSPRWAARQRSTAHHPEPGECL
jgi:nicotinamidase-related amidase